MNNVCIHGLEREKVTQHMEALCEKESHVLSFEEYGEVVSKEEVI